MSKHLSELYIKMKGQFHEHLLAFTAHDSVFFFLLLPLLNVGSDKDMFTSVANQPAGLQTYSY